MTAGVKAEYLTESSRPARSWSSSTKRSSAPACAWRRALPKRPWEAGPCAQEERREV